MTIEHAYNTVKSDAEKTSDVNEKIQVAAEIIRIPAIFSILTNPIVGLTLTTAASLVVEIANRRAIKYKSHCTNF
jgi:hypothetical protein